MEKEDLADDLLKGVEAIANYTGLTKRGRLWASRKGQAPGFQAGRLEMVCTEINLAVSYRQAGGEPCVIDRISAKRTRSPGNCCGMGLLTHG